MFNGAVHSFSVVSKRTESDHFFASKQNRRDLVQEIKKQLKWEIGDDYIGEEEVKKCTAHVQIKRDDFLSDIQEYASTQENRDLESIYMGHQQSCFNHLIEIHNNIGVYLPVFFFFPLHISIKQHALPIFIGSSVKLATELKQVNKKLKAEKNTAIEMESFLQATEEDVEDFESSHEGVDNFWGCFNYLVLKLLVNKSLQDKLPIFVF